MNDIDKLTEILSSVMSPDANQDRRTELAEKLDDLYKALTRDEEDAE